MNPLGFSSLLPVLKSKLACLDNQRVLFELSAWDVNAPPSTERENALLGAVAVLAVAVAVLWLDNLRIRARLK